MKPTPVGSVLELDPEELSSPVLLVVMNSVLPHEDDPYSPVELSLPVVNGVSVVLGGSIPVPVGGAVSVGPLVSEVAGPGLPALVDASPSTELLPRRSSGARVTQEHLMIRVEHVNLVVADIPDTLAFLQTALPSWGVRGEGASEWYGAPRRWLHFGCDEHYITLNDAGVGSNRDLRSLDVGLAHIGLEVDDVDAVRGRLERAGYPVQTVGADHPHRKTVYFVDPAGFEFEFIEYTSDDPAQRNLYGGETSSITRGGSR